MAVRRRTTTKKPTNKIEAARKKIKPASEQFQHLRMLVYGKPKKGKTTFGASGPKPVLIVDCNELGTLSVRKFADVDVYPIETWTDIDLVYWFLHNGDHDYQTVVIDTLTSLASLCMKFVLGDEASRDPTRDPMVPDKRAWGKVGQMMGTEILKFRNLPMNIVFLAQERRGYTEDEEEVPEVMPAVSPSVLNQLTPAVDIIGRLYVKEVVSQGKGANGKKTTVMERRMLIGDHEIYTTGDRSEANLPAILRLPAADKRVSLEKLIKRINDAKED
jgi:phage nucleotide-binding protein